MVLQVRGIGCLLVKPMGAAAESGHNDRIVFPVFEHLYNYA
jgi:hypothetical protein